jgi:hypothetical protein
MRPSLHRRNFGGNVGFVVVPVQGGRDFLFWNLIYGRRPALDHADPPRWGVKRAVAVMEGRIDVVEVIPN